MRSSDRSGGGAKPVNYFLTFAVPHPGTAAVMQDVKARKESGPTCELSYHLPNLSRENMLETSYCIYGTPLMWQFRREYLQTRQIDEGVATFQVIPRDAQCTLPQIVGPLCSKADEAAERTRAATTR